MVAVAVCIAAFVWDSLRVREAANEAMRSACAARRLYFLDDTVALESITVTRDDEGRLALRRRYRFAYSDTGHNRRRGEITLMGRNVVTLELEDPPPAPDPIGVAGEVPRHDSVN